jgi:hypothetical protein
MFVDLKLTVCQKTKTVSFYGFVLPDGPRDKSERIARIPRYTLQQAI